MLKILETSISASVSVKLGRLKESKKIVVHENMP
jgi:hypothetical protein